MQWNELQGREDLRHAQWHKEQRGVITGSFVANIVRNSGAQVKEYFPGPNIYGSNCLNIFVEAWEWFEKNKPSEKPQICLVGYSRGGYIALCMAELMRKKGHDVQYLGLFDPVSRDASLRDHKVETISSNVVNVSVACRSAVIGSRNLSMNYIGKKTDSGVSVSRQICPGSHGAVGGFPYGRGVKMGVGDGPNRGQGDPDNPKRFHPDKEFTAWWLSGNHIYQGAKSCGAPIKPMVPQPRSKWCMPRDQWYKTHS